MGNDVNFEKLLEDINKLHDSDHHDLWVPTQSRFVKFTPITVKQQKQLLSSGLTLRIKDIAFNNVLNEILTTNCKEGIKITTIDRSILALQLRSIAISDELPLYVNGQRVVLNINEHIQQRKDVVIPNDLQQFSVEIGPIHVKCAVPSLQRDTYMNDNLISIVGTDTNIDLTETVGDIYINDILKYITNITFKNQQDQEPINVEFNENLKGDTMVTLFDALPMNICIKIAENVEKLKKLESEILKNSLVNNEPIPVDANIFSTE